MKHNLEKIKELLAKRPKVENVFMGELEGFDNWVNPTDYEFWVEDLIKKFEDFEKELREKLRLWTNQYSKYEPSSRFYVAIQLLKEILGEQAGEHNEKVL